MRQHFLLALLIAVCALARPAGAAAPNIGQQPLNRSVTENQPVTFFVGVTGDAPLHYDWRRNGLSFQGAPNGPAFTIPFVALAENGAGFSVIITNSSGAATSSVALLTVSADLTPPTIRFVSNAPSYIHIVIGFSERVGFNSAQEVFNYSIPGANITEATLDPSGSNVTLTVDSELIDGAVYSVNVDNVTDVASSPNAIAPGTLFVFRAGRPPVISGQPQHQVVNPGGSALFDVFASGSALHYQWYRGLQRLDGETNVSLALQAVLPGQVGGYRVVISNYLGLATSAVATLSFFGNYTVNLPAGFSFVTKQLANENSKFPIPPSSMTLYRWKPSNGSFTTYDYFPGQGWSPFEPEVAVGEGVIINSPQPATLVFTGTRLQPMLPVSLQPGLNLLGAQVPIIAGYPDLVGLPEEGTVVYQYRPGGDPQQFNEDNYRINYFIKGQWRDQPPRLRVGEAAWVKVAIPVEITNQPLAQNKINPGAAVTFSVGATGEEPLRYQWRLNGQDIPGATKSTYNINSVAPSNAGIYGVTVGNLLGDINSSQVPLELNVPAFALSDSFAAQPNVTDITRLFSSHNREATTQPGEPLHGGKRTGASVWLTWTAPASGIVTMSVAGSGFDAMLAVYTGNSVSTLALVDANDDDAGYACGRVRFNARVATAYRICISGVGDGQGDILLGWNLEPTAALLPEFGQQPRDLTVGYGATAQFSAIVTNGGLTSYQWFLQNAPITNNPSATTSTLTITNVGDGHVGSYFVRAQNANLQRDSGRAQLQIRVPAPPGPIQGLLFVDKFFDLDRPEDGGGNPLKKPEQKFGTVHHGYSVANPGAPVGGYARDLGEPNHCGVAGGSTVWFTLRATNNGTLYVNTDLSTYNTLLAAYIGPGDSYATLTNVGCDNNSGLDGLDSRMSFPAVSNRLYYIAAGGVGSSFGTLRWKSQLVLPLTITNLAYSSLSGGRITMRVNGTPNLAATVQSATNFASPVWITLTNYTAPNGIFNFTNQNVGLTNRFYRVVNIF